MRDMQATADGLRSAIERSGYYPGLVADAVSSALGSEAVVSFFVHHDALFDYQDRYLQLEPQGSWTRSWSAFNARMWDTYRSQY